MESVIKRRIKEFTFPLAWRRSFGVFCVSMTGGSRVARAVVLGGLLLLPVLAARGEEDPEAPRTAEEIVLRTTTPLGEAAIVWPAGTVLENFEEQDELILLQQGPFSATVSRDLIIFPEPEPEPEVVLEEEAEIATEAVQAVPAETPSPDVAATLATFIPAEWRPWLPTAGVVLLGLYALWATVTLLRRRRSN
jgi:hypothetical protein